MEEGKIEKALEYIECIQICIGTVQPFPGKIAITTPSAWNQPGNLAIEVSFGGRGVISMPQNVEAYFILLKPKGSLHLSVWKYSCVSFS